MTAATPAAGARPRPTGCAGSSWPRCASSPPNCCSPRRPNGGPPRSCCAPWSRPRSPPATPPTPAPGCKTAAFPVIKTLDEFDLRRVLDPRPTFDYLASPGMDHRRGRTCAWSGRPAPARATCWSRSASPPSHAGHRVRYFTAAELVETLYRGLADNSVGRVIDTLLRNDLIICRRGRVRPAGRHRRPTAVPRSSPPPTNAAPWASPATGPSSQWGRFLPEHTTAVSLLDNRSTHGFRSAAPAGVIA